MVECKFHLILNRKLRYVAAELRCNKAIKWRCICEVPLNNFFDFTAASCFKFSDVISTVTVALKRLCPARPSALQVIPAKRAILLPDTPNSPRQNSQWRPRFRPRPPFWGEFSWSEISGVWGVVACKWANSSLRGLGGLHLCPISWMRENGTGTVAALVYVTRVVLQRVCTEPPRRDQPSHPDLRPPPTPAFPFCRISLQYCLLCHNLIYLRSIRSPGA